MKTLEELKAMRFIPLRMCSICGSLIGWYNNGEVAWFDPSCDCCSFDSGGYYDTWETVLEVYNKFNYTIKFTVVQQVKEEEKSNV